MQDGSALSGNAERTAVALTLFLEQLLNGLQLGMMLFLMASGLTLVVGIMNFINLAHGTLYMIGAFLAVTVQMLTGNHLLAVGAGILGTALVGLVIEVLIAQPLYKRDHLDQVLCTFGIILFLNELARVIWGSAPLRMDVPKILDGSVDLAGIAYPTYRLTIIVVSAIVAIGLHLVITRTRLGMLIRAGASDRMMIVGLGVNIQFLYALVFAAGAALAALAGILAAPIYTVQTGMGDHILILTLVVIVIGGIGSVHGALLASLLVGVIDTMGRVTLPAGFGNILIYVPMAMILFWRPRGLFPAHG
jgi:branched-chain amino acid transport system permease protein